MDNAFGGETNFVVDDKNNESDKTMTSNTQQVEKTKNVIMIKLWNRILLTTNYLTIFYNRALVYKQRLKKIYLAKIKGHS